MFTKLLNSRIRVFEKRAIFYFGVTILFFCQVISCNGEQGMSTMRKKADNKELGTWQIKAEKMVKEQIEARGVRNELVIKAMRSTQRDLFVPMNYKESAYEDYPLPIEHAQTISQPYIVAFMTEMLNLRGGEKVLEIGTGSGYQAAILSRIADKVYSVELIKELALSAKNRLKELGYSNVNVRWGDGYKGWLEFAPYDRIIVTAAPTEIPQALIDQLKIGGFMVIPVGTYFQELLLVTKTEDGIIRKKSIPVRFVPMVSSDEKEM